MPSIIWISLIAIIFIILITIVLSIYETKKWNNKIEEIKEEFGLIENMLYNVTLNNGRTIKNLTFIKIYKGNNSANGYINLLFVKQSKYRDGFTEKEVVIKYNSIWKVNKISASYTDEEY